MGLLWQYLQDLSKHVTKIHEIDTKCDEFSKLKDDSITYQRIIHNKVTNQTKINPYFLFLKIKLRFITQGVTGCYIHAITTSIQVNKFYL